MTEAPNLLSKSSARPGGGRFVHARALLRESNSNAALASAERMLAALHDIAPAETARVPARRVAQQTLMSPSVFVPSPRVGTESRQPRGPSAPGPAPRRSDAPVGELPMSVAIPGRSSVRR